MNDDDSIAHALAKIGAANTHEDRLAIVIASAVLAGTRPLRAQIAALEARLVALEQRPAGLKYCGVWRSDEQYTLGDFVTDHGAVWACNRLTRTRPGSGSPDWTLAVKSGRDAR